MVVSEATIVLSEHPLIIATIMPATAGYSLFPREPLFDIEIL
jgi:hypothetical protein